MQVLIVGGGIGGLAALSLHAAGIGCTVFEQVRKPAELGVGINTLPHAIKELAALGLLPALDRAGIRTRELIYTNRFGQVVWREPRGTDAGLDTPQFSIHRGKLHTVLLDAVRERLGADALQTGRRLVSFTERGDRVEARFERRDGGKPSPSMATRWWGPTASTPPHARCSTRPKARPCGTAPRYGAAPLTGRSMSMAAPW
jgi:5-methylphenazine-1-carboxylate 1-monooxygenase